MDFGEILDQWEQREKKKGSARAGKKNALCPSSEKVNPDACRTRPKKAGPERSGSCAESMEAWMNTHGVYDKDAEKQSEDRNSYLSDIRNIKKMKPDAKIDLHGLTRDEAWQKLDVFVSFCIRQGFRKILIIHGKGNHSCSEPVLNNMVRSFIDAHPCLGASGIPDIKDGGRGATWALIKKERLR